ncbi:MAG: hypothetical protein MR328_03775, partial [Firmicutes bacterium]|nr:hypothetical protein [Bacillota bacterium]
VLVDDIIPKTGGNCSFICKKAVTLENIKVYLVIVVRRLTLPKYEGGRRNEEESNRNSFYTG